MAMILHTPVRLTRRHLLLSEFVVLNVVITSMLSRLWVFFRGILRALIPVYRRTTHLLQKVSQSQPMAYLTDFTLPGELKDFLCLSYPDLLLEEGTKDTLRAKKGKQKSSFSLLSRLFEGKGHEEGNEEEEREMMPIIAAGYDEGSSLDLGAAVLQRRPDISSCGLNIKAVLQQSCKSTKQLSLETEMKTDISSQAAVFQKRKFLKSLKKVSSFRNMAAHLKEMMHWCRSCKFIQKRKHLAFLHLRCLRMESLEAEGVRLEKRLKRFKLKVQKALLLQNTLPQKHSSSFIALWRYWRHHGSFMARYRTARRRFTLSRKCSRPVKGLFVSLKPRPLQQTSKEEVSGHNKVPGAEEKMDSQTALQKPNVLNDDIDDIFSSLGF